MTAVLRLGSPEGRTERDPKITCLLQRLTLEISAKRSRTFKGRARAVWEKYDIKKLLKRMIHMVIYLT